jgi:hypothetical protein
MSTYAITIEKIQNLPEPLLQEVNDFVDYLLVKYDNTRWQMWTQFSENAELVEGDFADYLSNLEKYEESLARGEIKW